MNPGRELDRLIAEKVMGIKIRQPLIDRSLKGSVMLPIDMGENGDVLTEFGWASAPIKCYSTNLLSAWEVVDKLFSDGWSILLEGSELLDEDRGIGGFDLAFLCKCGIRGRFYASENTLPLAICVAALKALENS